MAKSNNKSVDFEPEVAIHIIPNRESYSRRERKHSWHDSRSMYDMEANNLHQLAMLTTGTATGENDEDEYCLRGLLSRKEMRKRNETIKRAQKAVIGEQSIQAEMECPNSDRMSRVYTCAVKRSQVEARQQGIKDALTIESATLPPPRNCREPEPIGNRRRTAQMRHNSVYTAHDRAYSGFRSTIGRRRISNIRTG